MYLSQSVSRDPNGDNHIDVEPVSTYHAKYACGYVGDGYESVEELLADEDVDALKEEGGSIQVLEKFDFGSDWYSAHEDTLLGTYIVNGANELVKEA